MVGREDEGRRIARVGRLMKDCDSYRSDERLFTNLGDPQCHNKCARHVMSLAELEIYLNFVANKFNRDYHHQRL